MKGTNEEIGVEELYKMFSDNENKWESEDAIAET
jgi:hypothetical protein